MYYKLTFADLFLRFFSCSLSAFLASFFAAASWNAELFSEYLLHGRDRLASPRSLAISTLKRYHNNVSKYLEALKSFVISLKVHNMINAEGQTDDKIQYYS